VRDDPADALWSGDQEFMISSVGVSREGRREGIRVPLRESARGSLGLVRPFILYALEKWVTRETQVTGQRSCVYHNTQIILNTVLMRPICGIAYSVEVM
jgi:hypothetical protein